METEVRIACLCPTYKRPQMLANSVACFMAQDHPHKRLFILDDCPQFHRRDYKGGYEIHNSNWRYSSLPTKYNELLRLARVTYDPHVIAIWEDDDVFLPWHLSQIAQAFKDGVRHFRLPQVYSNYCLPKDGSVQLEGAAGRFHSSWAFSVDLMEEMGGWPRIERLDFDQVLGGKARELDPTPPIRSDFRPSYVYRWSSGSNPWNGSQAGESGYKQLWNELGRKPAPWVGELVPQFDHETCLIYKAVSTS